MGDMVTMIEYQVVRPDGNLIYKYVVSSQMDFGFRPARDGHLYIDEQSVYPPWSIQRRESGQDWATVSERLNP